MHSMRKGIGFNLTLFHFYTSFLTGLTGEMALSYAALTAATSLVSDSLILSIATYAHNRLTATRHILTKQSQWRRRATLHMTFKYLNTFSKITARAATISVRDSL